METKRQAFPRFNFAHSVSVSTTRNLQFGLNNPPTLIQRERERERESKIENVQFSTSKLIIIIIIIIIIKFVQKQKPRDKTYGNLLDNLWGLKVIIVCLLCVKNLVEFHNKIRTKVFLLLL